MKLNSMAILLLGAAVFGCKKEVIEVHYVQQEDVQLVQPRITASNTVIDSFVTVKVDKNIEGAEIFYTDNGKIPTKNSIKFNEELTVKEPKEIKFKAYHKNFKASETNSIKLYKKGHKAGGINWLTSANEKYKGVGLETLINGKKASLEYSNSQWMGFDTIAKATVNFNKKTRIESIDFGYLSDPGSWIFPPTKIEVIIDNDKTTKLTFELEPLNALADKKMISYRVLIEKEVKTLDIAVENLQIIPDWHDGKGKKAWLFMDEWIFN